MMTDAPTAAKRAVPDRAIRRNWLANGRPWPANRVKFREATLSVIKPKQAIEFKGRMLSLTRASVVAPELTATTPPLHDFERPRQQALHGKHTIQAAGGAGVLGRVPGGREAG